MLRTDYVRCKRAGRNMSGSFGVYLTRKWLILLVKEYMLIKIYAMMLTFSNDMHTIKLPNE